jgi:hypothetical protein
MIQTDSVVYSPRAWGRTEMRLCPPGPVTSFLHRRGGEPGEPMLNFYKGNVFPHERGGGPWLESRQMSQADVFPTGVGANQANRQNANDADCSRRTPHERGGES